MSTPRDPDDIVRSWLEEGPYSLPDPTARAIDVATRDAPQRRRGFGPPWRSDQMPLASKLLGAAIVVVVLIVGVVVALPGSRPGTVGGPGGQTPLPSASPSPSPSSTGTPVPIPTLAANLTPLDISGWVPYYSSRYDINIKHPPGWTVRPSTHDWKLDPDGRTDASVDDNGAEIFVSPSGTIAISVWAADLPAGTKLEDWVATYCAVNTRPCDGIDQRTGTAYSETRDRHPGLLVPFADDLQAFFPGDGKVYVIAAWRPVGEFDAQRLVEAFALSSCLGCGGPLPTPAPSAS